MKSFLHSSFWAFFCLLSFTLQAQVSLPYYSGFDSAAERNGWTIYRLGDAALGNWSIANIGGFSAPSCISHDYSPSSGANVVDDWYVSPGFLLPAGGFLDSVRYAFSGFSVPTTGDTIGVYLLLGSQDPSSASAIIKLAEFRDSTYQADNTYRLLSGIDLSPTNESAYIGLRYRNAEASSRWLHVRFDNIAVSGLTTSVDDPSIYQPRILFPNPTTDEVTILHRGIGGVVTIYDNTGAQLQKIPLQAGSPSTSISLGQWPQGLYHLIIVRNNTMETITIARI